jgi:hypothetical protein
MLAMRSAVDILSGLSNEPGKLGPLLAGAVLCVCESVWLANAIISKQIIVPSIILPFDIVDPFNRKLF